MAILTGVRWYLIVFFFFLQDLSSLSGIKFVPTAVEIWSPNQLDHQGIPLPYSFDLHFSNK